MGKQADLLAATAKYLMGNYGPAMLGVVKGQGARLWDADGNEYIDCFPGFGAGGVAGHCHPAIVKAVVKQAATLMSHGNFFSNEPQVDLARRIVEHGFGGKVFFCHSGAEANEAALKLVRLAAGEGRYKIISFNNCFHGRTMGALSLTPADKQKGFEPMLAGNVKVNFGDLAALEAAIDEQTAGVFIEPIQGEGGMNVPTKAYMQGVRKICTKHKLLLVVDEVWTAPARTGRWFAHQHYGITPDVMTLAKAIGGGAPVAACVAAPKWADVLGPGKHGCTMGGNPLCAAAGAAAMKLIEDQDLVRRAADKGEYIMKTLRSAGASCVKDVRGKGFMIGIEVDKPAKDIFLAAKEAGLLIGYAQANIVRLAPPITVPDKLLDKALGILIKVLKA
ncbi:MAG: acetylornithine/succinylornithine family transaminase [Planctomycetaceae bacterium]|nr:acetylornithine/succinylornithine family transaminase [Planctomycetaceae bacterium]